MVSGDPNPSPLDAESLLVGVAHLSRVDPVLGGIVARLGNPPLWPREPGFATVVLTILEQQVSLASARAAFTKLLEATGDLTPERFLSFTDADLRAFGFSRQKAGYCRGLSSAILNKDLDLAELEGLDDSAARSKLTVVKGIGPWTADIYLLRALLRPDVWPSGDLALAKAVEQLHGLPEMPGPARMEEIAEPWRPWRAVAARMLWQHYLNPRAA